jgi:hypothetical protein
VTRQGFTTVLRRLTALIELGYLERIGNNYYLTAKSNVPNQRRVLLEHINNIQRAAKELSKMDIPPLTKRHGAMPIPVLG